MSKTHALSRNAVRLTRPILLPARVSAMLSLRRQRTRLAQLDAAALHDIGLTRDDALTEAKRPFWDVPDYWRA